MRSKTERTPLKGVALTACAALAVISFVVFSPHDTIAQTCVPTCILNINAGSNPVAVYCPSGTVRTGGGGKCEGADARLHYNFPIIGQEGWYVRCKGTNDAQAYIICCTAG